jgi:transposase
MTATVKAMKIQEVILKAASKQILWTEAADIIGVSYRTMKRWKSRYQEQGYDGIFDRRMKRPSPKRVPFNELQTILSLYRTTYRGFNVTHFHEKLQEHHGITRGYTFVKTALQTAGLVEKSRSRGKHRKRRPRKPLVGMMLHLDGSPHEWIPDLPGQFFDLLVLMDDATNEIYEILLVDEEDTLGCMTLLKDCIAKHGIFCSLYSDRASHFFFTPKAGEKVLEGHLTQIGRALRDLGVKMIPSYSPEARGRSERMNETLQGRIPNELKLHGIKTKDAANRFLKEVYRKEHNRRFKVKAEQPGSAFVPLPVHFDLDRIFSIQAERTVGHDNTVSFQCLTLQIEPSELRISFAKCRVTVHQHLDQTLSITYGPHLLGRYNSEGRLLKNSKPSFQRRAA